MLDAKAAAVTLMIFEIPQSRFTPSLGTLNWIANRFSYKNTRLGGRIE